MLVTSIITNNVQNDQFIADVLKRAKHSDIQTIAYSVFAETVPSALLFSATISSVVDHYADPSRKREMQQLVQLSTTVTKEGKVDDGLMRLIDEALSRCSAIPLWVLEAHQKTAHGQDVSSVCEQEVFSNPLSHRSGSR